MNLYKFKIIFHVIHDYFCEKVHFTQNWLKFGQNELKFSKKRRNLGKSGKICGNLLPKEIRAEKD